MEAEEAPVSDSEQDAVDEHLVRRHAKLEELARGSDSESVDDGLHPEDATDGAVLDIDLSSDSEEENMLRRPSAANIADSSDDEEESSDGAENDDADWGGRRRKYYGGDTEEHEIMEDEERDEALEEEEAEALRLQRKQLSEMQASDYGIPDVGNDADEEDDDSDDESELKHDFTPDLAKLTSELRKYYKLLEVWRERATWGPIAQTRYHLYATYATSIAFYLTLLTDPKSRDSDPRDHPVVGRLVELRKLIDEHETVAVAVPETAPPVIAEANEDETERPRTNESSEPSSHLAADEEIDSSSKTVEPAPADVPKKKRKKKKKVKPSTSEDDQGKNDEALVRSLLVRPKKDSADENDDKVVSKDRQRQLNKVTGALDSEVKNASRRKIQSADAEPLRPPPDVPRGEGPEPVSEALTDAAEVERLLEGKRGKKRARKEKPQTAHVYSFDDTVAENARRRASTQVVLNRGLTRYRPKEKKTPRTKNKAAYASAVKKRRTVVREAVAVKPGLSYGGEATGININARRGARLTDF